MKAKILTGTSLEQLEENLNTWFADELEARIKGATEKGRIVYDNIELHTVQQYTMQVVTPNSFNPQSPKVDTNFNVLIIYS